MVKLENIISVTGFPGLFKLIASRPDGLILEDLESKRRNFYSSRKTQFSPLESMGIYTLTDTVALEEVYAKFIEFEKAAEVPQSSVDDKSLRSFFTAVLPEHDPYRVQSKDMKKCVRWYHLLKKFELVKSEPSDDKPAELNQEEDSPTNVQE
ncbi:MAG TPA: DUF5606 domain-containing protein [Saprospiraceae bacterium]|nr:DUF5606 domain-containing protein [Saprospiraceae bacterium]